MRPACRQEGKICRRMIAEYSITFTSLKEGSHDFKYELNNEFFEHFNYADIEGADVALDVVLEKKPNMIVVDFHAKGKLKVMCDRCTDELLYPVEGNDQVIFKLSEEAVEDEKIYIVGENEVSINIAEPFYEFVSLLLPARRIHEEGECNQEMLEQIDDYLMIESDREEEIEEDPDESEDTNTDPRWDALKKLK